MGGTRPPPRPPPIDARETVDARVGRHSDAIADNKSNHGDTVPVVDVHVALWAWSALAQDVADDIRNKPK